MYLNKIYAVNQQGIALPLTLILLFVMTLIGIATLRTTTVEENLSANSRLRQVAFNAAETTLRDAELTILSLANAQKRSLFFSTNAGQFTEPSDTRVSLSELCQAGINGGGGFCIPSQYNTTLNNVASDELERWEDPALDVFNPTNNPATSIPYSGFAAGNLSLNGVEDAPRYIVEFLGNYDYKSENNDPTGDPSATPRLVRPVFDGQYEGPCRENGVLRGGSNLWPYCAGDPALYRITVRASAGPVARRASVTIQSYFRVAE